MDDQQSMQNALELAAFSFKVDAVTAEVTRALEAKSIPSILLKGPGIATWLYPGIGPGSMATPTCCCASTTGTRPCR